MALSFPSMLAISVCGLFRKGCPCMITYQCVLFSRQGLFVLSSWDGVVSFAHPAADTSLIPSSACTLAISTWGLFPAREGRN
jgi:hypothetical protein